MHLLPTFRNKTVQQHTGFLVSIIGPVYGFEDSQCRLDQCRCIGGRIWQGVSPAVAILFLVFFEAVGADKNMDDRGMETGMPQFACRLFSIGDDGFTQV